MLHVCSAVNYHRIVACNLKIKVIVLKGKPEKHESTFRLMHQSI